MSSVDYDENMRWKKNIKGFPTSSELNNRIFGKQ